MLYLQCPTQSCSDLGYPMGTPYRCQICCKNEQCLTPADKIIITTASGHTINLTTWDNLTKLSLQVLGMASVQCNQKCHHDFKYKLVPFAKKKLADRDQPLGPELFGDNLREHYKQIQEITKNTTLTTSKGKKQQNRHHPYPGLGRNPGYAPWPPVGFQQLLHYCAPYPAYPMEYQQQQAVIQPQPPPAPRPNRGHGHGTPVKNQNK